MAERGRRPRLANLAEEMKERAASRRSNLARSHIAYADGRWRDALPEELRRPQSPRCEPTRPELVPALPLFAAAPNPAPMPVAPRRGERPSRSPPLEDEEEEAARPLDGPRREAETAAATQPQAAGRGGHVQRQRLDASNLGGPSAEPTERAPTCGVRRASNASSASMAELLPALVGRRHSAELPAFRRGTPPESPERGLRQAGARAGDVPHGFVLAPPHHQPAGARPPGARPPLYPPVGEAGVPHPRVGRHAAQPAPALAPTGSRRGAADGAAAVGQALLPGGGLLRATPATPAAAAGAAPGAEPDMAERGYAGAGGPAWALWAQSDALRGGASDGGCGGCGALMGARLLPPGSADSGRESAAQQPHRPADGSDGLAQRGGGRSVFSARAALLRALPADAPGRARRWLAQARAAPLPRLGEGARASLRKQASHAQSAVSGAASGCAAGAARCAEGVRGEAFARGLRRCGACLLGLLLSLSYPAFVLSHHVALACSELRLEGLKLEHMCESSMLVSVNVSIASASFFSVQIIDLAATIYNERQRPLLGIAINGTFTVRTGRHVYPAVVELSVLDTEELLATLRSMAASLDQPSPIDEAYSAAAALLSGAGADANASAAAAELASTLLDVAGADADARPPGEEWAEAGAPEPPGARANASRPGEPAAGADERARGLPPGGGGGGGGDGEERGHWRVKLGMGLGSRVAFYVPLGGRVEMSLEVSAAAARRMRAAIGAVQRLAGCAAKGGLDFDLAEPLGLAVWPPELVDLHVGEVSKAGVHVSGAVRLSLSGPLAVERFPALSLQLCSAPDAFLRNAGEDGISAEAASGGAADVGAGQIGLGRASRTINHAVASTNLNWTAAQVEAYRTSHASYAEGCIATLATQPFSLVRGEPFELAFNLAVPFYGNSSARFYGPLYFAEEISRGGALVLRGSYDREIHELGARVFTSTYVERRARASSSCFVQRVLQAVRVRAHLLRAVPAAAPYIKDALLGASCMAGVFLHYFAHDNSTALNDDRVLEDCFAFMESSVAFGFDPARPKPAPHEPRAPAPPAGVRVPRPLGASFRPSPRDLSGRVLYRFATAAGAAGFAHRAACRWLNPLDASKSYYRPRAHVADVLACESLCIKLRDCWGVSFAQEAGHCELWNRVPRAAAIEEGSVCLVLEPQGSAFASVANPGGGAAGGEPPAGADGLDDGWEALLAGALNHSLVEVPDGPDAPVWSEPAALDALAAGAGGGGSLSEELDGWWEKAAPAKAAADSKGKGRRRR